MTAIKITPGNTPYHEVDNTGISIVLDKRFSIVQLVVTSGDVYVRFGSSSLIAADVIVAGASGAKRDYYMINVAVQEFFIEDWDRIALRTVSGVESIVHLNYIV